MHNIPYIIIGSLKNHTHSLLIFFTVRLYKIRISIQHAKTSSSVLRLELESGTGMSVQPATPTTGYAMFYAHALHVGLIYQKKMGGTIKSRQFNSRG